MQRVTGHRREVLRLREALAIQLTKREQEVSELVSRGFSNKDVGLLLGITEGTVKVHVHSAFNKLELNNRVELATVTKEREMKKERIQGYFRYIRCPECETQLCWVNPRLPNYCPECGKHIFLKLKFNGIVAEGKNVWIEMEMDNA
jgi:DNA-binding CsgD family transcriptional regulator